MIDKQDVIDCAETYSMDIKCDSPIANNRPPGFSVFCGTFNQKPVIVKHDVERNQHFDREEALLLLKNINICFLELLNHFTRVSITNVMLVSSEEDSDEKEKEKQHRQNQENENSKSNESDAECFEAKEGCSGSGGDGGDNNRDDGNYGGGGNGKDNKKDDKEEDEKTEEGEKKDDEEEEKKDSSGSSVGTEGLIDWDLIETEDLKEENDDPALKEFRQRRQRANSPLPRAPSGRGLAIGVQEQQQLAEIEQLEEQEAILQDIEEQAKVGKRKKNKEWKKRKSGMKEEDGPEEKKKKDDDGGNNTII
jgi:hypothetical protein